MVDCFDRQIDSAFVPIGSNISFTLLVLKTKKDQKNSTWSVTYLYCLQEKIFWGLVINKAMTFGLPVITTDRCIAGLELIRHYENIFIVPVERAVILLAKRIEEVLSDEQLATRMAKTSLKKIRLYTIENMAQSHYSMLLRMRDKLNND